ncbi:DmpA family aminopeptidase [Jiangella alkaliphila]|uniref:L-aminopeptidase DmpA. Serine peptidase. MEROPS family S58 n=1 Tax=Jiangella alkaliphila TaxID=419479 RepID=A0A1H2IRX1_9ACTN|nr:P1 family peptidase [Jiangella alkaliphila]SDU46761.1 L-aminopeptidase DmpA. Serine peptidase. MEROPS family S58 [Jiangella alkaliphila]
MTARSRDLGIVVGALPTGRHNAITDVGGVRVGHHSLVAGEGALVVGEGPVRTGVTIVEPRPAVWRSPVFAGLHRLNGNGEMTGLPWIQENGQLTTAIGLTNTHSVGVVRDAIVARLHRERGDDELYFHLPVVAETYDGILSDINGQHVTAEHVDAAFDALSGGAVPEGSVGSGTGMICHEFKGGIGTSSRLVTAGGGQVYTVGVLVQANHGRRGRLRVNGVPVGERIPADVVPSPFDAAIRAARGSGSIIVLIATDAPLLPHQCDRLAQRAALGIGRTGGSGENGSGDLILAFATGNDGLPRVGLIEPGPDEIELRMVSNAVVNGLFDAVIDATEEAILNAIVAATTCVGRDGITAAALDHALLREAYAR